MNSHTYTMKKGNSSISPKVSRQFDNQTSMKQTKDNNRTLDFETIQEFQSSAENNFNNSSAKKQPS
jgi:hypothetical protein